jgi:hypothetical protein
MQSNQEARARSALSLFDLSQRGNGQCLRNTTINGEPVRISGAYSETLSSAMNFGTCLILRSGTSKLPMEVRWFGVMRRKGSYSSAGLL